MIIFQLGLLYLCLRYRRTPAPENENDALLYDADIEQERAEEPLPSQSPAQFRVVVDPPSPSGHDEPLESTRTLQRPKPLLAALRLPRPQLGAPDEAGSLHLGRPFNFWQWSDYSTRASFPRYANVTCLSSKHLTLPPIADTSNSWRFISLCSGCSVSY